MKAHELISRLQIWDQRGVWSFTLPQLRVLFPGGNFFTTLRRHVDSGLLTKISKGLYVNPLARSRPANVLPYLVPLLRPWDFSYLSLESVLHDANQISQMPNRLTVMTTGRSLEIHCAFGTIELIRTQRKLEELTLDIVQVPGEPLPRATPDRARKDLRKARRNVDLLDSVSL